ncbi:MAG: hypothetical protein AB8C02_00590 [Halioglobus sp.]
MTDSSTPIVLVVCNDYGELAFALYLLANQSLAKNATLMLPPRLHEKNPNALPGRTRVYHSVDDIHQQVDSSAPGILGLFSGYLLPIHRLLSTQALESLLQSSQSQGWRCITSDPFLGLLDDVEPSELVTISTPKLPAFLSFFKAIKKVQLAAESQVVESVAALNAMQDCLQGTLHVYPCGDSPGKTDSQFGKRLHFRNPDVFSPGQNAPYQPTPEATGKKRRWLFVLGNEDHKVQERQYGNKTEGVSRKFRTILLSKLHETLKSGSWPILIAPPDVIEAVAKHSPVADSMELLPNCEYAKFQSLLGEAEYVFYWNAVSFSCILRTVADKPWFTFDDGHLLRGMNTDYAKRISNWFYRGEDPPRLDIKDTLSGDMLTKATGRYLQSAWRIRQGLLGLAEPEALHVALEANAAIQDAFEIVQLLCEIVADNKIDGSAVVDVALLSFPKRGMKDAARLLAAKGTAEQADVARSAAPKLSFFQHGIGPCKLALDTKGPEGTTWRTTVESEMSIIKKSLRI